MTEVLQDLGHFLSGLYELDFILGIDLVDLLWLLLCDGSCHFFKIPIQPAGDSVIKAFMGVLESFLKKWVSPFFKMTVVPASAVITSSPSPKVHVPSKM
jgi:hypothetical protein